MGIPPYPLAIGKSLVFTHFGGLIFGFSTRNSIPVSILMTGSILLKRRREHLPRILLSKENSASIIHQNTVRHLYNNNSMEKDDLKFAEIYVRS